jgi:hypothetical protein
MNETEQQRKERERQEDLQRLREFRPIDDDFMRCLFKDNVPLAELVLRIITDKQDLIITEKDFYGKGEPIYVVERINLTTGKNFEDGEHILYVNGEYREESELGKLMHDFNCTEADDMIFGLMAERTRYLKENPEGVNEMCKAMEDMRNEAVERNMLQTIRNLMDSMKWSAEQAMTAMKIPEADKLKYTAKL